MTDFNFVYNMTLIENFVSLFKLWDVGKTNDFKCYNQCVVENKWFVDNWEY